MPDVGDISKLSVLFALLPGLLTYLVTHFLTTRHEAVNWTKAALEGLGYTLIAHATWTVLKLPGSLIPTPDLVGLTLTGVGWGLILSFLSTRGWVFKTLRRVGLTAGPPWTTIWQTTFNEYRLSKSSYVVLHLKDGRRVYGSVYGVSATQRDGHVYLNPAVWLAEDAKHDVRQVLLALNQGHGLLFNAEDVYFVEFVPAIRDDEKTKVNPEMRDG